MNDDNRALLEQLFATGGIDLQCGRLFDEPPSPLPPTLDWDGVRVNFPPQQVERLKDAGLIDLARQMSRQGRVSSDELAATPGRFLMCTRGSYGVTKLLDKVGAESVVLVWSLWRGYWERGGGDARVGRARRRRAALHPQRRPRLARGPRSAGGGPCAETRPHLGTHGRRLSLHSIVIPGAGRTST